MKKVQLYADPIKDEVVYKLFERLENESQNTRGYVQNQIKERLKAFELLCKEIGTDDPMEVVVRVMKGVSVKENMDTPKSNEVPDESAAALEKFAEVGISGNWIQG